MIKKIYLELFKLIYFIRRSEELLAKEYRNGTMKTPTHFGIGQEGISAGICFALTKKDVVFTHHRSHTHYLAKGGSFYKLACELLGRIDGCSGGRGGSVHIIDSKNNFLGSSPILGHSVALATGAALAIKMKLSNEIAVAFFGEGAFDEGSVWESINYAAIKKLPVLYVCENNLYATESPLSVRRPKNTSFIKKAEAFGIKVFECDGNDTFSIYKLAKKCIPILRKNNSPVMIYANTYRWLEHVGPLYDHEVNRTYRTKKELNLWQKKCPLNKLKSQILEKSYISEVELNDVASKIDRKLNNDLVRALKSSWPKPTDIFDNA